MQGTNFSRMIIRRIKQDLGPAIKSRLVWLLAQFTGTTHSTPGVQLSWNADYEVKQGCCKHTPSCSSSS